jgi:hypothetical protein
MSTSQQFIDDSGADPARRTGDENVHANSPSTPQLSGAIDVSD